LVVVVVGATVVVVVAGAGVVVTAVVDTVPCASGATEASGCEVGAEHAPRSSGTIRSTRDRISGLYRRPLDISS
jgi:hypothetical protein